MVTTERYKTALVIKHLKAAMMAIAETAKKVPATYEDAKNKLVLIGVLATEALVEADETT